MFTRIALFALALTLPLAACGDDVDTYETDDAIESDAEMIGDDIDGAMDEAGAEAEQIGNEIEAETNEAGEAIEGEVNETAGEVEEATDDDGM